MSETETASTFTCDNCGKTRKKGWSDEEAAAEALSLHPASDLAAGTGVVCDDCFTHIMGRVQVEAPELLAPGAPRIPGACYRSGYGFPVHMKGCRCPR